MEREKSQTRRSAANADKAASSEPTPSIDPIDLLNSRLHARRIHPWKGQEEQRPHTAKKPTDLVEQFDAVKRSQSSLAEMKHLRDRGSVTARGARPRPDSVSNESARFVAESKKVSKDEVRSRANSDPVALSWDFNIFWHPPRTPVTPKERFFSPRPEYSDSTDDESSSEDVDVLIAQREVEEARTQARASSIARLDYSAVVAHEESALAPGLLSTSRKDRLRAKFRTTPTHSRLLVVGNDSKEGSSGSLLDANELSYYREGERVRLAGGRANALVRYAMFSPSPDFLHQLVLTMRFWTTPLTVFSTIISSYRATFEKDGVKKPEFLEPSSALSQPSPREVAQEGADSFTGRTGSTVSDDQSGAILRRSESNDFDSELARSPSGDSLPAPSKNKSESKPTSPRGFKTSSSSLPTLIFADTPPSVFTILLPDGTKKVSVYNGKAILGDLLRSFCMARTLNFEDYEARDSSNVRVENVEVPLDDLRIDGVHFIPKVSESGGSDELNRSSPPLSRTHVRAGSQSKSSPAGMSARESSGALKRRRFKEKSTGRARSMNLSASTELANDDSDDDHSISEDGGAPEETSKDVETTKSAPSSMSFKKKKDSHRKRKILGITLNDVVLDSRKWSGSRASVETTPSNWSSKVKRRPSAKADEFTRSHRVKQTSSVTDERNWAFSEGAAGLSTSPSDLRSPETSSSSKKLSSSSGNIGSSPISASAAEKATLLSQSAGRGSLQMEPSEVNETTFEQKRLIDLVLQWIDFDAAEFTHEPVASFFHEFLSLLNPGEQEFVNRTLRYRLADIDPNHLTLFIVRFVQAARVPRKFPGQMLVEYLKIKKQLHSGDCEHVAMLLLRKGLMVPKEKELLHKKFNVYTLYKISMTPLRLANEYAALAPLRLASFPSSRTVMDFPPHTFAAQWTCYECRLFQRVRQSEIVYWLTGDPSKRLTHAPHLSDLTTFVNQMSLWVATEIVLSPNVKKRRAVLIRMILLAQHLYALRNYQGLLEIVLGLQHAAVLRMKNTWRIGEKYQELFDAMAGIVAPHNNWQVFRKLLGQEHDAVFIPYIGMYLSDLTFIKDGPGDQLPNGQVGWRKNTQMAAILSRIAFIQTSLWKLPVEPDAEIISFLSDELYALPESEIFAKSRTLEPNAVKRRAVRSMTVTSGRVKQINVATEQGKEGQPKSNETGNYE